MLYMYTQSSLPIQVLLIIYDGFTGEKGLCILNGSGGRNWNISTTSAIKSSTPCIATTGQLTLPLVLRICMTIQMASLQKTNTYEMRVNGLFCTFMCTLMGIMNTRTSPQRPPRYLKTKYSFLDNQCSLSLFIGSPLISQIASQQGATLPIYSSNPNIEDSYKETHCNNYDIQCKMHLLCEE